MGLVPRALPGPNEECNKPGSHSLATPSLMSLAATRNLSFFFCKMGTAILTFQDCNPDNM